MPKLDSPLQLSPVFKPKIWGRVDLSPIFPRPQFPAVDADPRHDPSEALTAKDQLIGEVWITDDAARFLNPPLAGMTLGEAGEKFGPELHGKNRQDRRFPILAKYIYTSDWLSVQVHPDDAQAQTYDPGNRGKCEMWYIVHSDRKAEILLGSRPGVTKENLQAAFQKGTSRELLNRIWPKAGEAIYVPPGTVHALGPGLVLFEVEENSDLTYRLDDFGRPGLDGKPRPLHLDKGLAVTRVELPAHRDLPRLQFREPYGWRRYVLACRFFALEGLTLRRGGTFAGKRERVEVLSLLEGEGRVETAAGWLGYQAGDTWLIPPATGTYRLVPRETTRLLKFYLPDLEEDFRQPLARRGVRAASIKKIVFD
jgi:mannose-6-phosphate isomerase